MKTRRNAILIFSKPPVPGLVKTRLSTLKDGNFTPEVASWIYHCMLFDVVETCCDALAYLEKRDAAEDEFSRPVLADTYDLIISTTPKANLPVMQQVFEDAGTWPRNIEFIYDSGRSFDEHYNDAFEQVFARGYDTVLSFGADMPALTRSLIWEGFDKLHDFCDMQEGGCVISPDQELGVSLIGWTRTTKMDHDGVFYNQDGLTVLPAYIEKLKKRSIRTAYLPAVPDVDTMADLLHNVTLVNAMEYCAAFDESITVPRRTIDAMDQLGLSDIRIMPNDLHDPREGIDE